MAGIFHQVDLRLERARKYLAEFQNLTEALRSQTSKSVTVYSDDWSDLSEPTYISGHKAEVLGEIALDELSVVIDDVVHNLRAALNYLVRTLASLKPREQPLPTSLKFPIESKPDVFNGNRRSLLWGVNAEHVAMIERVQPYNGCYWTKLLQSLSNTGKHVELIRLARAKAAISEDEADAAVESARDLVFSDVPPEELFIDGWNGVTVDVETTVEVAFPDGVPAVDKLQELETQVSDFIAQFKASIPDEGCCRPVTRHDAHPRKD